MESITMDRESERCPAGLEILINQKKFTISLNPKGGVGDFEILNSSDEVILIGQKHLGTISLLENTSRSEVLTVDLSNPLEITIACPPSEDIATISNTRMGLCSENTLEIHSKQRNKRYDFKFTKCTTSTKVSGDQENGNITREKYNFQVANENSVVVVDLLINRLSSKIQLQLPGVVNLSPVQAAVVFGGLAFQIYSLKKQKNWLILIIVGSLIFLIILLIIAFATVF